jgi:hypothetical protein
MTKPLLPQIIRERRSLPVALAKRIAETPLADQGAQLLNSRLYQAMTPAAKLATLGALQEVRYKSRRAPEYVPDGWAVAETACGD